MELTPEAVRSAQFRIALRGYSTSEVDEFLAKLEEGVTELQAKVRVLTERAERAERAPAVAMPEAVATRPAAPAEDDASVRRTLVLAQRAADLVVREAKSVADKLVAEGEAKAKAALDGVHEQSATVLQAAEARARDTLAAAEAQAAGVVQSADERARDTLAAAEAQANRVVQSAEAQASDTLAAAQAQAQTIVTTAEATSREMEDQAQTRVAALTAHAEATSREQLSRAESLAQAAEARAAALDAEAARRSGEIVAAAQQRADEEIRAASASAQSLTLAAEAEVARRRAEADAEVADERARATAALEQEVARLRSDTAALNAEAEDARASAEQHRILVEQLANQISAYEAWMRERRETHRALLLEELASLERFEAGPVPAPPGAPADASLDTAPRAVAVAPVAPTVGTPSSPADPVVAPPVAIPTLGEPVGLAGSAPAGSAAAFPVDTGEDTAPPESAPAAFTSLGPAELDQPFPGAAEPAPADDFASVALGSPRTAEELGVEALPLASVPAGTDGAFPGGLASELNELEAEPGHDDVATSQDEPASPLAALDPADAPYAPVAAPFDPLPAFAAVPAAEAPNETSVAGYWRYDEDRDLAAEGDGGQEGDDESRVDSLPGGPSADDEEPPGEAGYGEAGYGESGYGEAGYGEAGYGEAGYGELGYEESGYEESASDEDGGEESAREEGPDDGPDEGADSSDHDNLPIHVVLRASDEGPGFVPPWDLGGRSAAKTPTNDGSLAARLRRARRDS